MHTKHSLEGILNTFRNQRGALGHPPGPPGDDLDFDVDPPSHRSGTKIGKFFSSAAGYASAGIGGLTAAGQGLRSWGANHPKLYDFGINAVKSLTIMGVSSAFGYYVTNLATPYIPLIGAYLGGIAMPILSGVAQWSLSNNFLRPEVNNRKNFARTFDFINKWSAASTILTGAFYGILGGAPAYLSQYTPDFINNHFNDVWKNLPAASAIAAVPAFLNAIFGWSVGEAEDFVTHNKGLVATAAAGISTYFLVGYVVPAPIHHVAGSAAAATTYVTANLFEHGWSRNGVKVLATIGQGAALTHLGLPDYASFAGAVGVAGILEYMKHTRQSNRTISPSSQA